MCPLQVLPAHHAPPTVCLMLREGCSEDRCPLGIRVPDWLLSGFNACLCSRCSYRNSAQKTTDVPSSKSHRDSAVQHVNVSDSWVCTARKCWS